MVSYRQNNSECPKLSHHKGSGQGVVRLNGRDVYCGRFGTAECLSTYHRTIAEWLANGRRSVVPDDGAGAEPGDLTINELALAYVEFACCYYRKNGRETSEVRDIRLSIRKARRIYLGPSAQAVLHPLLRAELSLHLFSPREAMEHRLAGKRASRKTRIQPSQRDRSKAKPKRAPGDRYDTRSYYHAVIFGIRAANKAAEIQGRDAIPHWHPNQLRHNAATRLRREFDLDVARAVLGHSSPVVTEVYAELDETKAAEAMERAG